MIRLLSDIDTLVVHCSDTRNGRKTTVAEIDSWHRERGFKRSAKNRRAFNSQLGFVGYHFIILADGTIETGRAVAEVGSHATGHNKRAIGICLVGLDRFSVAQWTALTSLVEELLAQLAAARAAASPSPRWTRGKPGAGPKVVGHRDLDAGKTCPGFDVAQWITGGMKPLAEHTLP